jgi:hypothetical protein
MPIEKHPRLIGLEEVGRDWGAKHGGRPYKPGDKTPRGTPRQEDWQSVATKFGVDVDWLIYFNYMTNNTDVVNWYLRHYVGCKKVSPSGNNWMFSNEARPGIIYIPPYDEPDEPDEPKDKSYDYDPDGAICAWSPKGIEAFRMQLKVIAQGIPGHNGERIKRLVRVISRGPPWVDDKHWYYNPKTIERYVDWKTQPSDRWKSTQATKGAFPFDGQAVWHGQQQSEAGGMEFAMGMWRIHAVKKMFDDFCNHVDPAAVKKRLLAIDDEMYQGWYAMQVATDFRTHQGGGNAIVQETWDFVRHVSLLTEDEDHLYWAFGKK